MTRLYYLHRGGVDFYRVKSNVIVRQEKMGSPLPLNPTLKGGQQQEIDNRSGGMFQRLFGKNVLVIGKELLHYRREKYPPTSAKNLSGIISNDVADLFPMLIDKTASNGNKSTSYGCIAPDFYYRVLDSQHGYNVVDIWAWDCQTVRGHYQGLRCEYVVPEDALFISAEPEVTLYTHSSFDYAVAHDARGFVYSRTFVHPLKDMELNLFFHSLGQFKQEVKRVNSYLQDREGINVDKTVVEMKDLGYPPSLNQIQKINLRPFKAANRNLDTSAGIVYRLVSYAMFGYITWSFITIKNLDSSIAFMEDKIKKVNNQVTLLATLKSKDTTGKLVEELDRRISHTPTPLDCLDVLAGTFSTGTYVNQLNIIDGNIEASLTSPDPAEVIKRLNESTAVSHVQLKGEPIKDAQSIYRFRLSISIKPSELSGKAAGAGNPVQGQGASSQSPQTQAEVPKKENPPAPAALKGEPPEKPKSSTGINKSSNPGVIFKGIKVF